MTAERAPTLRVAPGDGPLRAEHERLLRTALRRGDLVPERAPGEAIDVAAYPRDAVEVSRATWLERMVHEHHSAAVFSRLLPQLMEAEATIDVKTSVLRMAMDELRHATLCAGVVEALGGTAAVQTPLSTEPLPAHEDATRREAALRNVMFAGCMSETVALAMLTEERELTREPLVLRAVTQLAADEVLHAKLGWAFLAETWPALDAAARARTDAYLPVAFGYLERKMLAAMPPGPPRSREVLDAMHALGCLDARSGRELFAETVTGVVVPRLEEFGLRARRGWDERRRAD